MRLSFAALLCAVGLLVLPQHVAAQTDIGGVRAPVAEGRAGEKSEVAALFAGLSPARKTAVARIDEGLDESVWQSLHTVIFGLEPAAREDLLARLERMDPLQLTVLRSALEQADRALWPQILEDAGVSAATRKAHSLARVDEQLLPGEKTAISAFLQGMTIGQSAALRDVTDRLTGFGERGLFVSFLAGLEPVQQPAMIQLIEHMSDEERAGFAEEIHLSGYENWHALPAFLAKATEFEMLRVMFRFLPCRRIDVEDLEHCHVPEGTEAFFANWRLVSVRHPHPVPDTPDRDSHGPDPLVAQFDPPGEIPGDIESRFTALTAEIGNKAELQSLLQGLGKGEQLRFMAFFGNLTAKERESLLLYLDDRTGENLAAEMHQIPPEAWPILPRFLASAGLRDAGTVLDGYFPCDRSRTDGGFTCNVPKGLKELLAARLITVRLRYIRITMAHGVAAKPSDAKWQAQIFKFGKSAAEAEIDTTGWQAQLFTRRLQDYEVLHACGGVYIKAGWVLTAAHCVDLQDKAANVPDFLANHRVRLGTIDIASGGGSEWRIDGAVRHADANAKRPDLGNDIALLHIVGPVARPLRTSESFEPAPIRLASTNDKPLGSGEAVELTGWGVTGVAPTTRQPLSVAGKPQVPPQLLQIARLQYWAPDYCNRDPRFLSKGYKVQPGSICAGSQGTDSACFLDSGGPLVQRQYGWNDPRALRGPVLIGLVSYGIGCGNVRAPSGFVDVRFFDDWIKRAMAHYKPGKVVELR